MLPQLILDTVLINNRENYKVFFKNKLKSIVRIILNDQIQNGI